MVESNLHGEIPFVPYYGFKPDLPKPKQLTPPIEDEFPKRLRADLEESYGNAVVSAFKEMCHDAICDCPACRRHAKTLKDYFELPVVPDRWEGKKMLLAFKSGLQ